MSSSSQNMEIAASNRLSAAMFLLRQYYTMTGRPDLTETPPDAPEEPAPEPGDAEPSGEALTPIVPAGIVEDLMYILMDNTEGAYFTRDLILTDEMASKFSVESGKENFEGIENFVQIFYEPVVGGAKVDDLTFYRNKTGPLTPPVQATEADADETTSAGGEQDLSIKSMVAHGAKGAEFNVNEDPLVSDRYQQPTLSAFVFPNHRLGPATRGAGATALFVNAIPSIEMSRCVPHIKVTFVSAVPYGIGQKTRQLSILRFLGMNSDKGTYDKTSMRGAIPEKIAPPPTTLDSEAAAAAPGDELLEISTQISAAGMELFTSPQTMVNANINNEEGAFSGGAGGILDPFLPLMTLEKLNIRIAGVGQALHCNKTGNISFVLHDRSRMADIAPLLAVDLFSMTHLVVEWGWNHPDGFNATENAYGALLHSMKSISAFNIVASNWTIGNDGQVRVDMSLASRGASELKSFPIATGRLMPVTPFKNMLVSYLAKKLESVNADANGDGSTDDTEKNRLAEIRASVNLSMNNASSPSTVIKRDKFLKFLSVLNPPKDTEIKPTDLTDLLKEILGDAEAGTPGTISSSNDSLTAEISAKTSAMLLSLDPFFPTTINENIAEKIKTGGEKNYISLGKVLMTFIGAPLAGCGRFDEVQMMFYRFNNQAGAARDYESIANFLISKNDLSLQMKEFQINNPSMSIQGFANHINTKILSVPSDVNYGLTALANALSEAQQKTAEANKAGTSTVKQDLQQEIEELNSQVEERLKTIYQDGAPVDPKFQVPKISMLLEALPAFVPTDDPSTRPAFEIDASKIILRVHIFDQNASPHTNEMFLVNCMNDSDMAIQMKTSSDSAAAESAPSDPTGVRPSGANSGTTATAKEESRIQTVESKGDYEVYTSNISSSEMKRIIKNTVPSLTYGMGWSALTNFSMRSTTGGSVGTAMLINAVKSSAKGAGESPSETSNMEDVTVIPANASMSLLGCPLFEYGQQFFIDLGTGTTADNMYRVTGVEHSLSQGEFTTNVTLGFNGSGTMRTFRSVIAAALPGLEKETAPEEG